MKWLSTAVALLLLAGTPARADVFRPMTMNVHEIGSTTSAQGRALISVIGRVCPDIVVMQEVTDAVDLDNLASLAGTAGYPFYRFCDISGTMSGSMRTACMSKYPIVSAESWSSRELSGDPYANDISRDVLECRIALPSGHIVGVMTVHQKSGIDDVDRFRRAIEVMRLCQAIQRYKATYPDEQLLVGGDFNEDLDNGPFGQQWTRLPTSGLPYTFRLGSDITWPVTYEPFQLVLDEGLIMADATWEDSTTNYVTYDPYDNRLDYLFYSAGITNWGDEVYYSREDDGEDNPPPGNWLEKCGDRISTSASRTASDHFAVFADFDISGTPPPTFTPTPSQSATPTRTPTLTATPTTTPVVTASPTVPVTPPPEGIGVELVLNAAIFLPGDWFHLGLTSWNSTASTQILPLFIILDVYGAYFFWPGWGETVDYETRQMPSGHIVSDWPVLEFTWPATDGAFRDLKFWAAFTSANMTEIVGVYDNVTWGYGAYAAAPGVPPVRE